MAYTRVWLLAVLASWGAFMFGIDTGSIGAVTVMSQFSKTIGPLSAIVQGLVVSIMIFTSAVSGLFAGPLSDRISRKYTMAIGGAIFSLGSLISALSPALSCLFVGRSLAGIGEGLFLSIIAVYCVEIAPARIRGRVTSIMQALTIIGIAVGFFICWGSAHLDSSMAWRLPFVLQAGWASVYAAGCALVLPFSPRWLYARGRVVEAERARMSLEDPAHKTPADWEVGVHQTGVTWREVFAKDVRRRTYLALFLQAAQQMSGIDALQFYAPTLFYQAGITGETSTFLASGVSGLVDVVAVLLVIPFMDRMGRRPFTIAGGILLGVFQCLVGSIYASGANEGPARWVVIVSLYLFLVTFCCTWAMTIKLYASEIQPIRTRATVSAVSTACNQFFNTLVALTIPIFLEKTQSGPYWLFMACLWFTAVVAWFMMPETKGRTLVDINLAFSAKKSPVTLPPAEPNPSLQEAMELQSIKSLPALGRLPTAIA